MQFTLAGRAILVISTSLVTVAGYGQTPTGPRTYGDPVTGQTRTAPSSHAPAPARTGQAGGGQSGAAVAGGYQAWQDPIEGAFAVSLPRGWQVSIGTRRTTRLDAHYVVRAKSPSGGAQLFMDDPRIALRQVPNT